MEQQLITEIKGPIGIVAIDRPSKLNALNKEVIAALAACIQELQADPSIRVIILTGSGDKAFVAGADIAAFSEFNSVQGTALAAEGQTQLFNLIEQGPTPVIAAINGYALGGGLELAMACHMRLAAETAKMGLPEVSLGLIPGYGGTQRLPQLIGKGRANELIFSAQMIGAEKALNYGLVNQVVPLDQLMEASESLAKKIAQQSPTAITAAIRAVNAGYDPAQNGYATEINAFGSLFGSPDFTEGTSAFLEKRKANFTGEKNSQA